MADLIARLEGAERGSRELDAAIAEELGEFKRFANMRWCYRPYHYGPWLSLPYWTDSLDTALTLVPEGWFWEVGCNGDPGTLYISLIRGPEDQKRPEGQYAVGLSNTPALALCIAALKAREKANG